MVCRNIFTFSHGICEKHLNNICCVGMCASKNHQFCSLICAQIGTYFWRTVYTLTILNRSNKHVVKLGLSTQKVGPHKVHHTPVLLQVVLERIPS